MQDNFLTVIQSVFEASQNGTIHFGEVIQRLAAARVESYLVDYRTGRASYYLPDDTTVDVEFELPEAPIAKAFDGEAVKAAIRGAQSGKVKYPEFKVMTQAAGCTGYIVWISGRHVSYFGRCGEVHVERFPD